jgi:4-amino-4-deoxy-L-arabinose transferase-like glycosyltransferase
MEHRRLWHAASLLIAAAAFGVVALVSQSIFERIPHVEDEAAYWFQAQVFAQGRLVVPTPPEPQAYNSPFVIDMNGLRFGKYPPGFPLLLTLGMLVGAPWAVNALLAAVSLWLTADLGRRLYSPTTGLLAAALGLSCPALLAESGSLLSHTAALALTVLFVWAFVRMHMALKGEHSSRAWRWGLLAGFALGYMALTRPFDALGVGLPFGAFALVELPIAWRRRTAGPDRARATLAMGTAALLVSLILPIYWHALTGQFTANPYLSIWPYDHPGFGPDVGVHGYTVHDAEYNLVFNLRAMATGLFGWPYYLNLLFVGLAWVLRPRQGWNYLLLAWCLSIIGVYATYWFYGGHDGGFPRYYFVALPALWLLSGRGVELAVQGMRRLAGRVSVPLGRALPALTLYPALVGLTLTSGLFFLPPQLEVFRGRYGVTAAPLQPVQRAGLQHALVFVEGVVRWTDFAVFFAADSPTLDSSVVYAISLGDAQDRAVRQAFPGRTCYVQRQMQLSPCDEARVTREP